jgi:hypothetical protein
MVVVVGLDHGNTVLIEQYDAIVGEYRRPDPQSVPAGVLDRLAVLAPERVLDASFWRLLADAPADATAEQVHRLIDESLRAELGLKFAAGG